jgi:hypothetical protein
VAVILLFFAVAVTTVQYGERGNDTYILRVVSGKDTIIGVDLTAGSTYPLAP